ncbi:hypothetical protein AVEN_80302-1 [Araneus ventricosus]|uniref:BTB domain-containing protein n=1 Tax=Araneus ventricosus TaxID=182803 RepID=A0A4Y2IKD0_ARAVE|nr:hypothetical protein AVEN_80302-1 [Araneus ventricosus]
MWRLVLFPRCGEKENHIGLHLFIDSKAINVEIDSEIAFLALDATVLQSVSCTKRAFGKLSETGPFCCAKRECASAQYLLESYWKKLRESVLTALSSVNNGSLSDIKLRISTQTYPAHKFFLSARSPMFKAMFSTENKQKINDYVDIENLDDDTISQLLRYIYRSEVEQLDWSSATKLYVGADKFQILPFKDIFSSFLRTNSSVTNACEALELADLRQDEDLKGFVQDFILSSAASMASGEKKRRTEEENREFNQDWTETFAFMCNTDGLPTCLICHENLAHNKKSNLERHFTTKHTQFAGKYPTSDARKKAVEELQKTITVKFHAK